MRITNEKTSAAGSSLKAKIASSVCKILIHEANVSTRESPQIIIYEPVMPQEILLEQVKLASVAH